MLARFVVCSAFCLLIALQPCALLFGGDGKTSAEERPTKKRRLNPEQTGVMPAPLATQVVSPLPIVIPMDSKASHTPLAVTVEPLQEAASATDSLPDVLLGTQEELIAFMQSEQSLPPAAREVKTVVVESEATKGLLGKDQNVRAAFEQLSEQSPFRVIFELQAETVQNLASLLAFKTFPAYVSCCLEVTQKLLQPTHAQLVDQLKARASENKCEFHLTASNPSSQEIDMLASLNFSCDVHLADLPIQNVQHLANLRHLNELFLRGCNNLADEMTIPALQQLTDVAFSECDSVKVVRFEAALQNLKNVRLTLCRQCTTLDISLLSGLESVVLEDCASFETLYTDGPTAVKHLIIELCERMATPKGTDFPHLQTLVLKSLEEKQARQLDNFLQLKDITVEEQACQELLLQNMPQLECAKVVGCYALRKLALTQLPVIEELTVEHSGVRESFTIHANVPSLSEFVAVDCDVQCFNAGALPQLANVQKH